MMAVLRFVAWMGLWLGVLAAQAQIPKCVREGGSVVSVPIGWASPYFGTSEMGGRRFLERSYGVVYREPVGASVFPKDLLPLVEAAQADKRGLVVFAPSISQGAVGALALNTWRGVINTAVVDLAAFPQAAEHVADLAFILGEGRQVAERTMIALDHVEVSDGVTCLWLSPSQAKRLEMRRADLAAMAAQETQPERKASWMARADFLGEWGRPQPRLARKGLWHHTLTPDLAKQVVSHARNRGTSGAHPIQLPSTGVATETTLHSGFQCEATALFPLGEDDAVPRETPEGSRPVLPRRGKIGLLKGVITTRKQVVGLGPVLLEHRPEVVLCEGLAGEALELIRHNHDRGLWDIRFVNVHRSNLVKIQAVTGGKLLDAASWEGGRPIPPDAFGHADAVWLEVGRLSILDTEEPDLPILTREELDRVDAAKVREERVDRLALARKTRRAAMRAMVPVIRAGGRSVYELRINAAKIAGALKTLAGDGR